MPLRRQLDVSFGVMNPFIITCMYIMYIYIYILYIKTLNEIAKGNFKKHFNPIEYVQYPEFSTTPAVFISDYIYIYINCQKICT